MIPETFIQEIQSKIDIVDIISSYISVKKAGRNFKALCPFHGEKTPSLVISPQKQIFHCFGCGEGGGVFQFLMLIDKMSFPEAVEILAERLGLAIPYQLDKQSQTKKMLFEVVHKAALFFHNNIKNNKKYKQVINYLDKRGIGEKTIDQFLIGYSDNDNSLLNYLRKSGFTLDILEKASLIISGKNGFYDLFRGRIMFPIFDVRSRVVGFGARSYQEQDSGPKYINSLDSIIYNKRNHLFGLNLAKDYISKEKAVIVVEGYLDMITPFMRGVKNIVASLGTALTLEQVQLIKRYTSHVVLMYDADKAGQSAALRSSELLLENDVDTKVIKPSVGEDPDSLFKKGGKDLFMQLLKEPEDFFEYKMNSLKAIYDPESIDGKSRIAQEMFSVIKKLNSEIKKHEYIRKLASGLDIKEEIVIAEFRNNFLKTSLARLNSSRDGREKKGFSMNKNPLTVTEKVLIKYMLTDQNAFNLVKKNVKQEYFTSGLARKVVTFLFNNGFKCCGNFSQATSEQNVDKEVRGFIAEILLDDDIILNKTIFKDSLMKICKKGVSSRKEKLKDKIKEAESKGDTQRVKELIKEYETIKRN